MYYRNVHWPHVVVCHAKLLLCDTMPVVNLSDQTSYDEIEDIRTTDRFLNDLIMSEEGA